MINYTPTRGFPGGANGKEPARHCRRRNRHRFNPWVRKEGMEEGMATHSSIYSCLEVAIIGLFRLSVSSSFSVDRLYTSVNLSI